MRARSQRAKSGSLKYWEGRPSRIFTQEDPIGLAGGLNLYGFAGGDPVNFADPFGLCPLGLAMRLPTILGAIRVNPTGKGVRGCDGQGCGHFGARREGGRTHLGADYLAEAGQDVRAVATGQVAKIGWPYADDTSFRLVDIDALDGSRIREFYVSPGLGVEEGAFVFAGQVIGTQQPLGGRYSGITEHVHAEIWENGKPVDPEKRIGGGN